MDLLSKNAVLTGLRCHKALWWLANEPSAPELKPSSVLLDRFDQGREVGELARTYLPGGILVGRHFEALEERIARTVGAIEGGASLLYEAAFAWSGAYVQVDLLERLTDGWCMIEVKSSTSVAPKHVADAAVQLCVLRGAGVDVRRVELMHLNKNCFFPKLENLFVRADITADTEALAKSLPQPITDAVAITDGALPDTPAGDHCWAPDACPFVVRCHAPDPPDHVDTLYRLSAKKRGALSELGIDRIPQIPDDFPLTQIQDRQRRSLRAEKLVVEPGLAAAVEPLRERLAFLDFETVTRAIPTWDRCAPWQQVPAQFSCHVQHPDGRIEHHEWLADGPGDPRRALAEHLLLACDGSTAVLAYSAQFEKGRIEELALLYPDLKAPLYALADRLVDLLPIVREHVYHPAFGGSFGLKAVAPPLLGIAYDDLDVGSGGDAALAIGRLLLTTEVLTLDERSELRRQLLEYCKQDTWCLVRLLTRLRELAAGA